MTTEITLAAIEAGIRRSSTVIGTALPTYLPTTYHGPVARAVVRREIEAYNNVIVGKACGAGFRILATVAVARGLAKNDGFFVWHLGANHYFVCPARPVVAG